MPSRALYFSLAAFAAAFAAGAFGAGVGCGANNIEIWTCLNPSTGKEDPNIGDADHYVNGQHDPCHCYDPCGPSDECPIVVDAGPPGPECPASDGGGGGP